MESQRQGGDALAPREVFKGTPFCPGSRAGSPLQAAHGQQLVVMEGPAAHTAPGTP
jgi:hypothetical protein